METIETYRRLIERVLTDYAKIPYSYGDIQRLTVFDRENDHYLLMIVGREGIKRVHGCLIHVDIINGKFWIQRDGTEQGIATELLQAGIPHDKIVLVFRSPKMREYGDFAVA